MKKTNPKKRTHGSTINEEVTYTFPLVTLRGIFNNHSSFFIPLRKLVSWPLLTVRNRVDEGLKNLLSRGILALISRIRRTMVENATYIYIYDSFPSSARTNIRKTYSSAYQSFFNSVLFVDPQLVMKLIKLVNGPHSFRNFPLCWPGRSCVNTCSMTSFTEFTRALHKIIAKWIATLFFPGVLIKQTFRLTRWLITKVIGWWWYASYLQCGPPRFAARKQAKF